MVDITNAVQLPQADFDAVVVGAGFAGLYAVHKLRNEQGLRVLGYDSASDVGGTWFHNRYPGALSDTESFCYRYSFDKELLQEGSWTDRYLTQPEILSYLNMFADRYDLRRSYQFRKRMTDARFDEGTGLWSVVTDDGRTVTAKYLVSALGVLSAVNKPSIPGENRFRGKIIHTADWPAELDLANKRVGVVGTGSTGVQVITALAPTVGHMTVFQRSPQYVVPIVNRPEPGAVIGEYIDDYDQIWAQIRQSAVAFGFEESVVSGESVSPEERNRVFERAWQRGGGFRFMFETFSDVAISQETNEAAAAFIRMKIAEVVQDPETRRKLTPTDLYAKRPLCATDYYAVYNRDNVALVDVKANPIVEFTEEGILLGNGDLHELDVMIMATGFDAVDGNYTKLKITGREGVMMSEKWRDGPLGYLGMMESGFPNLFMVVGPNGPFTNIPPTIETQADWISDLIAHMEASGVKSAEPRQDAEDVWVETCRAIAGMTLFAKTDSWIFGANIPGKKVGVYFYMGGLGNYRAEIGKVKDGGYQTLMLS
ncbi:Baeyer-Villiger monooxygenase (plasmid) [Sphingobium sp. AntQ-1]|uniref:flavin-containing monooxygenase n=1 Tax=Sphingobium sp. AntQ-1 TaxID=2930091 RepID=UPI00234F1D84|nr:NAD(P)/FAD-dependent oxidoreductase [Sphingobium sp. AntQ-1]WCP15987.1 Baeyer-Villiger monooxygenase [Sphingobium sp. AntQ-1]